jgi:hypothetical protein
MSFMMAVCSSKCRADDVVRYRTAAETAAAAAALLPLEEIKNNSSKLNAGRLDQHVTSIQLSSIE